MTERMKTTFDTKEDEQGKPWIVFEMYPHKLKGLQQGVLGFDLKTGTSRKEAQALADILNNQVENFSFTPSPWPKPKPQGDRKPARLRRVGDAKVARRLWKFGDVHKIIRLGPTRRSSGQAAKLDGYICKVKYLSLLKQAEWNIK